jgi:Na+(H+)/acetate symporter ActP
MMTIMGWPYWVGIVVVGSVITFNVALGGMKGITFVQAFQYWAKLFAIAAPVFVLMAIFGGYNSKLGVFGGDGMGVPRVSKDTPVKFVGKDKAPANTVALSTAGTTKLTFTKAAEVDKVTTARKAEPGEDPIPDTALILQGKIEDGTNTSPQGTVALGVTPVGANLKRIPEGGQLLGQAFPVTKGGVPVEKDGKPVKTAAKMEFATATEAMLGNGSPVPNAQNNKKWIEPYGTLTAKHGYPMLYTYSLIIALICGTAGLPHILVRFYTNPDGRSAKATTFWVMVLIGAFYAFTPIWGTLGRADLPILYANNKTDSVVIALPKALQNPLLGDILSGITSAGAFAAFMSTFSGLLVSMSGAWAHDIYGKILKARSTSAERVAMFKYGAVVFGIIAMGLGLLVEQFDIAMLVGWAFAIAAASYFPLLLMGAWWRGLTMPGAAAGMLGGGLLSLGAIIAFMLSDKKIITIDNPLIKALCEQPAIWGVPLSLLLMYIVSNATRDRIPADVDFKMLRLHAPEEMGLSKDYVDEDERGDH